MNNLDKAKAKAAKDIARAEAEQAVIDGLPDVGLEPRAFIQHGKAHISYNQPQSFEDVLRVFDAFNTAPAFDCKSSGSRGTYATERGDCLGEYAAWITVGASVGGGQTVSFKFFTTSGDQVSIVFSDSSYSRKYQGTPWHADFYTRFVNMKPPRAVKYKEYRAENTMILATCAAVVSYSTGTSDGSYIQRLGYYATRDCLKSAIDTLAPSRFEIVWKREVVDSFETADEAEKMLAEYNMAYGGGCVLKAIGGPI